MKIFRNPKAVIILCVLAVGLVLKNVLWPIVQRSWSSRSATRVATVEPSKAAASTPAPARPVLLPPPEKEAVSGAHSDATALAVTPMNRQEMWSQAPRWAKAPRRDPFQVRAANLSKQAAKDVLTLMGVLRQTGGTLAVLNNRVVSAGDSILGYTVETVEHDRVWVGGPNGREAVEFKYAASAPPVAPEASSEDSPQADSTNATPTQ